MLNKIIAFVGSFGSDSWKVAQMAHFLAGAILPIVFYVFVPFSWSPLLGACLIDLAWGIPKEFYLDVKYEKASYTDGAKDLAFYILGSGVMLFLLWLKGL